MGLTKTSTKQHASAASPTSPSSSTSRFPSLSLRSKPSSATLQTEPLTAHDSLLRVARRSHEQGAAVTGKGQPTTASSVSPTRSLSPGDKGYSPLQHPVVPYPVDKVGVPVFKHEEFGWCANQDFRHTSQVRWTRSHICCCTCFRLLHSSRPPVEMLVRMGGESEGEASSRLDILALCFLPRSA